MLGGTARLQNGELVWVQLLCMTIIAKATITTDPVLRFQRKDVRESCMKCGQTVSFLSHQVAVMKELQVYSDSNRKTHRLTTNNMP